MTRRRNPDPAELARIAKQLLDLAGNNEPANDEEKPLDEEAIRERAERAAERMIRARKR